MDISAFAEQPDGSILVGGTTRPGESSAPEVDVCPHAFVLRLRRSADRSLAPSAVRLPALSCAGSGLGLDQTRPAS